MKKKDIFDTDSQESNESKESSEDTETMEPETETDEECEEAWSKVVLQVAEHLRDNDPTIQLEDQNEQKYILEVMLPVVMKTIETKLNDAKNIRNSETYGAVEEEKARLMDNGMGRWEANKMALENRRYLVGRQISLALQKELHKEEEEDDEWSEKLWFWFFVVLCSVYFLQ